MARECGYRPILETNTSRCLCFVISVLATPSICVSIWRALLDVAVCLPGFFCTFTLFIIVSFVLNEHHGLALLSEGGGGLFHCNYLCRVRAGGRFHGLLPCSLGLLYRPANIQRYLKDRNVRDGWLPWFCYNIRLYLHCTVTAA